MSPRAPTLLLAGLLCAGAGAHAAQDGAGYATLGRCAGYPRLLLSVPKGWCVGLVADARDGLRMPRRVLEVAPGRFWITDMGFWEKNRGRLLELRPDGQAGDPGRITVLASRLDRPHGLARGPDGRIYVGEAGAIWRTPVNTFQRQPVLDGLPADGAHPLKELHFSARGHLYVNVGSSTDACRDDRQQQAVPCPDLTGPTPRAAVYEAVFSGPDRSLSSFKPYATGLRNSLGLASTTAHHGAERLWQAENSVDYAAADAPAEELNELERGSHHGWPYCVSDAAGRSVVARGYEGRVRCDRPPHRLPAQAWPAHAAPLQLLAVPSAVQGQPETPWSGRLLAVWHGYRQQGHRIVAWRIGPDGRPTGARETLVTGWSAMPGIRPMGTPAGVTVDHLGRLWIVEDRNRTVLVVARDG